MANWDYGGVHMRYHMNGIIDLPNDSHVMVCDWLKSMPDFMKQADTIFVDPPWNIGNAKTFYTKAELPHPELDFPEFMARLWNRLDEIAPNYLFLEMGKQYLAHCITECERRYKYVTFYNSTYYHKPENKCYIIHATNDHSRKRYPVLEDKDEEDIIAWICANHQYHCIGDLCMGLGLVGKHAFINGRQFVGTELNQKRLAHLIHFIAEKSAVRIPNEQPSQP